METINVNEELIKNDINAPMTGKFNCRIGNVRIDDYRLGGQMVSIPFIVLDGKYEGKYIWGNFMFGTENENLNSAKMFTFAKLAKLLK